MEFSKCIISKPIKTLGKITAQWETIWLTVKSQTLKVEETLNKTQPIMANVEFMQSGVQA